MSIIEEVTKWVEGHAEDDQKVVLEDLQRGGCISGMVGPLVNYVDTLEFYERNKQEINEILAKFAEDQGEKSAVHQITGFDRDDPLCLEQQNQNLMAWVSFEEVANRVYMDKYES